jgi:hypothetical protein
VNLSGRGGASLHRDGAEHRVARQSHTTSAYTTEFHHEFRAETGRLLVRRFLWFTTIVVGFAAISLLLGVVAALSLPAEAFESEGGEQLRALRSPLWWSVSVLWLFGFLGALVYVWRRRPPERTVLRISAWVVVFDGLLNVFAGAMSVQGSLGIVSFFITHLVACLFLPWTARQALRPMLVVLGVHAAARLLWMDPVWRGPSGATLALVAFSPLLAVPGTLWCWVRHSQRMREFRFRFVSTKYSEMRRELVDARRIHESLFPKPIEDGPVRFTFEYEPMRQLGGDFLYARRCSGDHAGPFDIVLLDVTGHGIPAALTVNRLHGELERIYAENPGAEPGGVLRLLNRYVHLTLSSHSIYVTGMCIRVDCEDGTLEYASGGHPPAFLRAVDGTVEELASTAFVLGACPDEAFDAGARRMDFGPGDTLLAYTDGAIEARDGSGKMFRIEGIRRMVASADARRATDWPRVFKNEVVRFRGGPPEDDTLLLVVHRAVGAARDRTRATGLARAGRSA